LAFPVIFLSGYGAPQLNDSPRFPGCAPNPTYLVTKYQHH